MTIWYAQSGSTQWAYANWNDQADGMGNSGTPASGDTANSNGQTAIDCAGVVLTGITLSGGGFWCSSYYAQNSDCTFANAGWNGRADGTGYTGTPDPNQYTTYEPNGHTGIDVGGNANSGALNSPLTAFWSSTLYAQDDRAWSENYYYMWATTASGGWYDTGFSSAPVGSTATYYSNGHSVDYSDVDMTRKTRSGDGFYASKWYARHAGNWQDGQWNSNSAGTGHAHDPIERSGSARITCDLNGYNIALTTSCESIDRVDLADSSYSATLTLGASCTLTDWTINLGLSFSGAKTLTLVDSDANSLTVGSGSMLSLEGDCSIGVTINSGGKCTVEDGATMTETSLSVASGGTLELVGDLSPSSGSVSSGGTLRVFGPHTLAGSYGTLSLSAGAILDAQPAVGNYTDPGEAHVEDGVGYTFAGDAKEGTYDPITGNYTDPGEAHVEDGVGYTFAGDAKEGTYDPVTGQYTDPGQAHVEDGVSYTFAGAARQGSYDPLATLILPDEDQVRDGTTYGFNGALEGTRIEPDTADVKIYVQYGSPTNPREGTYDPITGDYTDPGETHVEDGVGYTFAGSPKTGTYDPITGNYTDPGEAHVEDSVQYTFAGAAKEGTYDPITGNYTDPGEAHVEDSVQYTFAGQAKEGTYDPITGNYTDPGEAHVEDSVQYTFAGDAKEGTFVGGGGISPADIVAAEWVVVGHSNYIGGDAGTYPTTATSQAIQLASDVAAITAAQAGITTEITILGVTGTLDLDLYTLISGVASADDVRAGTPRYDGGPNGNLIVPSAAALAAGVHAGWYHGGEEEAWEVTGTAVLLVLPSAPDLATGIAICIGADGLPGAGHVISCRLTAAPEEEGENTGKLYSTSLRQATSGEGGALQFANLIRGATYEFWGGGGPRVVVLVPAAGEEEEESFELPVFLYDDRTANPVWVRT